MKLAIISSLIFCFLTLEAAELYMGPYLESQSEDSMSVKWESETPGAFSLKWGQQSLEQSAEVSVKKSPIGTYLYFAKMEKLDSNQIYQYVIFKDDKAVSEVHKFRARVSFKDKNVFRFLAISDTQENPAIHKRLVEEGVIANLEQNYPGPFYENLDFAVVAGDLVGNGNEYQQFKELYFDPAKKLQASIPYYPAIGNHDRDYKNYLFYFTSPDNGFGKVRKHGYTYKYLNARFLSINTDQGFLKPGQLVWINRVMRLICSEKDVDFVFAYYHHPFHSEMWTNGNTPYTKLVLNIIQRHLNKCRKAGAALNGHTHAYSRGQETDSPFYYVNVASAGGRLDYWGAEKQKDYEEFQKSFDEFGYSLIEVTTGPTPSFKIQRFSMGDDYVENTNELQAAFYYRTSNQAPHAPQLSLMKDKNGCYLDAGEFIDLDGDLYQSIQWQISNGTQPLVVANGVIYPNDWPNVYERVFNYENIYNGDTSRPGWSVHDDYDSMKGVIYNQLRWPKSLTKDSYTVRARYRDRGLVWSEWAQINIDRRTLAVCF